MCTPALPKPIPAKDAASTMSVRAARSLPVSTARRNERDSSGSAFSMKASETGLFPTYTARCSGRRRR